LSDGLTRGSQALSFLDSAVRGVQQFNDFFAQMGHGSTLARLLGVLLNPLNWRTFPFLLTF
jgi:hypothetical protein